LSTASRSPRCLSDSGDRLHSHARPWVCLRALSEPRACLMPSAPFGPSRRQDDNPHRASLLSTLLTDLVARWFRGAGVSCRGLPAKGRGYYVGGRPCERIPRRCMAVFRVLWVAEVVRVLRVCRSELTPSFLAAHVSGACPGAIICRRANCAERSALGLFCHKNLVLVVIIVTLTTFPPTLCLSAPVCMCLSAPSTLCLHKQASKLISRHTQVPKPAQPSTPVANGVGKGGRRRREICPEPLTLTEACCSCFPT
jgi:hypothetical protein